MTANEAKSEFVEMVSDRKMRMLALLAHNLTICARSAYLPEIGEVSARKRLHALNELLHVVTGQLMHMVAGDANRYPDNVFMDILREKAQIGHCEADLLQALQWSKSAKFPASNQQS